MSPFNIVFNIKFVSSGSLTMNKILCLVSIEQMSLRYINYNF